MISNIPRTRTRRSKGKRFESRIEGRAGRGRLVCTGLAVMLVAALLLGGCAQSEDGSETQDARRIAETRDRLRSLGYVNLVSVDPEEMHKTGVTRHLPDSSYGGLNLFNSRDESLARLMTMDGRVIHTWASDARGRTYEVFDRRLPSHMPSYLEGWNHIEMLENGGLLVIGSHHMLLRLDWNSNPVYKLDMPAHHDLAVSQEGDIYVLTDGVRKTRIEGRTVAFQDNLVVVIGPEGDIKRTLSVFDGFDSGPLGEVLNNRLSSLKQAQLKRLDTLWERFQSGNDEDRLAAEVYERAIRGDFGSDGDIINVLFHNHSEDIFHSNSIQVLEEDEPGLWRKGDLLICICYFDMIAVLDHDEGSVVWTWGAGDLERPHHATGLADGSILVFDNGSSRGYSRIVRMDPQSGNIVWEYVADPPESFYSDTRGGCQELPNGSVLVADTNSGRAFEITPGGKTVWEYFNEVLVETEAGMERGAIYRMTRLDTSRIDVDLSSIDPAP